MTALRLAVALLAAGLSTPAMARSQAQLDCAIQRAPAGLGDSIAAAMVAGDRAAMRPLQQRLEVVVRQCVTAQRMRDAEAENYYDYALARLPGEALSRQLGRAGIATARLDTVLGYRAGRPNTTLPGIDGTAEERMSAVLAAAGIDEKRLSPANLRKVSTYIELAPRQYRALQDLG